VKSKIQKWGNSLAFRIPKVFANEVDVHDGSRVDLLLKGGNLILAPIHRKSSLNSLLAKVTQENTHSVVETGEPIGGEIW
jgi:antitoxin MazE